MSTSNQASKENQSTHWTRDENKTFEIAVAIYDEQTPDRWQKVAALVPGKTVSDVIEHYRKLVADIEMIEAGSIPVPDYGNESPRSHDSDQQSEKPDVQTEEEHRKQVWDNPHEGGQEPHSPGSSEASNDDV